MARGKKEHVAELKEMTGYDGALVGFKLEKNEVCGHWLELLNYLWNSVKR